jgi:hypothetical protein
VKREEKRPRYRWEDNIKVDLEELGCGDKDWIDLAQDKDRWRTLVNAFVALGQIKFVTLPRCLQKICPIY